MLKGMTPKSLLKLLLQIIFSVALTAFLISNIELPEVDKVWYQMKPGPFFIYIALTLTSYALRSKRFQIVSPSSSRINFNCYLAITSLYNFFTSVLPSGSGEISYPILLKKYFGTKIGESITTLLVTRLMQVVSLILFFFVSMIFLDIFPFELSPTIVAILCLIIIFIIFILLSSNKICIFIHERLPSKHFFKKINSTLDQINVTLSELIESRKYFKLLVISILITFTNILTLYFLVRVFNFEITLIKAIFCLTLFQISAILPIHGFGKFGTYESIATVSFLLIDIPKNESVILGFSIHILSLLIQFILAILGFLLIKKMTKQTETIVYK